MILPWKLLAALLGDPIHRFKLQQENGPIKVTSNKRKILKVRIFLIHFYSVPSVSDFVSSLINNLNSTIHVQGKEFWLEKNGPTIKDDSFIYFGI